MIATIEDMTVKIYGLSRSAKPRLLEAIGQRSVTTLIAADMAIIREGLMQTIYGMGSLSPAS